MIRLLLGFFLIVSHVWAAPKIAVSIQPIHSIVSNITQGVTTPSLLLDAQQSAHHFHLKPKQLSLIEQADLLVIVHPTFESGLAKVFQHAEHENRLSISPIDDEKHEDEAHKDHEGDEDEAHEEHQHAKDPHLWLDIEQMQAFAHKLTRKLVKIDPKNQSKYLANLVQLERKLSTLHQQIAQQLDQANSKPLATYSNAFEVFIEHYQLNHIASVVEQHEQRPSIKNLLAAKKSIQQHQAGCLLASTDVSPKQINLLKENLHLNTTRIDILGSSLKPGADLYFDLMQKVTQKIAQCLR